MHLFVWRTGSGNLRSARKTGIDWHVCGSKRFSTCNAVNNAKCCITDCTVGTVKCGVGLSTPYLTYSPPREGCSPEAIPLPVDEPDGLMFSLHLAQSRFVSSFYFTLVISHIYRYMLPSPASIYARLCWPVRPSMGCINVNGLFVSNALIS